MPPPVTRRVWLGLGGNIGDVRGSLSSSLRSLDDHQKIEVFCVSSLYRTPPWGLEEQPWFLNCCAEVRTSLSPRDLLTVCRAFEDVGERDRSVRWGPRTIDIDILVYEGEECSGSDLTLPHPGMFARAFVLVPLSEIAADIIVSNKKVSDWASGVSSEGLTVEATGDWHL